MIIFSFCLSYIYPATEWRAPQKYSFNIDISIEVDARFIDRQGSAEKAVEYINFLVSAANLVFEHEVDAHCEYDSYCQVKLSDGLYRRFC